MKIALRYGLLGLTAFLGFLLLQAPATLVVDRLVERFPGLHVQTVEGSALEGTATALRWRHLAVPRLHWQWRPLTLLTGWLEFTLNLVGPEFKFTGQAALGPQKQVRLRDGTGAIPLAQLASWVGYPDLPAQGTVTFDIAELRLDFAGRPQTGRGFIRLHHLHIALGSPLTLGDFIAEFKPLEPQGITGTVRDQNSPLVLESTVHVTPDGHYRGTGYAAVRDVHSHPLRQLLNLLLGSPSHEGRWNIHIVGSLSF